MKWQKKFQMLGKLLLIVVGLNSTMVGAQDTISEDVEPTSESPATQDQKPTFDFVDKNLEDQRREFEAKTGKEGRDLSLFFDPRDNGVETPPQVIEYDMTNGTDLSIGPLLISGREVSLQLTREASVHKSTSWFSSEEKTVPDYVLSFSWPQDYLSHGKLELIDDAKVVHWSKELSEEDVWTWQSEMSQYRAKGKIKIEEKAPLSFKHEAFLEKLRREKKDRDEKGNLKPTISAVHLQSLYGLTGSDLSEISISKISRPFRFCLKRSLDEGRLSLCSRRYKAVRRHGVTQLITSNKPVQPQVHINNRPVTVKGSAIFLEKKPIKLAAITNNGTYVEFFSRPNPLNILDMTLDETNGRVVVVGFGHPPMGPVELVHRGSEDFWDFLNFMPTIGDLRDFWRVTFAPDKPYLYLRGQGGAPFKQEFFFSKLPTARARVKLVAKSAQSTYAKTVALRGTKGANVKVASTQKAARPIGKTGFEWDFLTYKSGKYNRSYLMVQDGEERWKAYYEVYRGFPFELSVRMSGVVSDSLDVIFLSEAAGQFWFEKLLGWDHPKLSLQRWGLSARYFRTLTDLSSEADAVVKSMTVMNLDMKYRFSPGIWGRDPSLGLMLSAQQLDTGGAQSLMLGGGLFWARSMPKFFDDLFNLLPFMSYPKWVDMEIVGYAFTPTAGAELGVNWALNFHGKVQWTRRFFGEAGFGLKQFDFADPVNKVALAMAMGYGTVGIGYNF